jgi:hypothetical protein
MTLLAILLIISLIATFTANKIKARITDISEAEENMLQFLTRFTLTIASLFYFYGRVNLMAMAVVAPGLYVGINFIILRLLNRFLDMKPEENKLISDMLQVGVLALVCGNLQYII